MAVDPSHDFLSSSGSTTIYTHSTDLASRGKSNLHIASLKFPELQLRLPVEDDAAALLRLFTDHRNIQYDKSCSGLDTPTAISALIKQWLDVSQPLKRANIVVVVEGKTVGTGGLGWIGRRKSDGKLIGDAGMMLDSDLRRKGYAYEALCMVIDHGFRVLGMDEVHVSCVDANVAFKGMMNVKFGFGAQPIQDKMFGNEWIWRVTREMWCASEHSDEGRERDIVT
ncbi:acyl-CoA N-acyltransferase [Cucurbitaria berberidis CBS 394.84]|uniref:Acyl-CoA N-acyltransferase n=1 Tax=Cucurbitaria berberidis CBS 394.84 TaxID=1168544 RepID=A0A9P4G7E8_9PLEO|nr:acyl-CoA N-acyltransferase [Cucurbitaria berberidis CBS 394.84]KAF1840312.1 acyl-CoA N-acyltransferase [Cucurbitaria berberidis CBS 394.84]